MTKLYPFQLEGATMIYRFRGRALLADEMGLGKTLQSLYWVSRIPSYRPVVIICPSSVKYTWQSEAHQHFNLQVEVIEGFCNTHYPMLPSKGIMVLNYDILPSWLLVLRKLRPRCLIIDEVHYIKNPETQRTKAVHRLAKRVASVVGLSGTPLTNRPIELWSVLKAIRPDIFPSKREYAWRYCAPRHTRWGWKYDGSANLKELNQILRDTCMIRRLKKDVVDLPRKERKMVAFRLKSYKEYDQAQDNFLKWLRKTSPARAKRAAKSEAVSRIGYLIRLATKLKLPWTIKWIEEFLEAHPDQKLVAFTMHTFVIDELKARFPSALVIDGRVTGLKRKEVVRQFRSNPRKRLLFGNWIAAGVGLNLQNASNVAALDIPWTPADLLQGEDRCHRIGQKYNVIIRYLIALGTIEEKQFSILRRKTKILDAVLDGKDSVDNINIFDELLEEIKRERKRR